MDVGDERRAPISGWPCCRGGRSDEALSKITNGSTSPARNAAARRKGSTGRCGGWRDRPSSRGAISGLGLAAGAASLLPCTRAGPGELDQSSSEAVRAGRRTRPPRAAQSGPRVSSRSARAGDVRGSKEDTRRSDGEARERGRDAPLRPPYQAAGLPSLRHAEPAERWRARPPSAAGQPARRSPPTDHVPGTTASVRAECAAPQPVALRALVAKTPIRAPSSSGAVRSGLADIRSVPATAAATTPSRHTRTSATARAGDHRCRRRRRAAAPSCGDTACDAAPPRRAPRTGRARSTVQAEVPSITTTREAGVASLVPMRRRRPFWTSASAATIR